ncbi:MAG: hypothetical protein P8Y04_05235, partial [Desulfobulbaceae bacterium]
MFSSIRRNGCFFLLVFLLCGLCAVGLLLTSAGENWHLFDTLDVIKYGTSDTSHFPTSLLLDADMELGGGEQLPVAGVPYRDLINGEPESIYWGVVEGTTIGYIYTLSWYPPLNPQRFEPA